MSYKNYILKKQSFFLFLAAAVIVILVGWGVFFAQSNWQEAAKAASSMPWQDGGTITQVSECVLDSACSPTCILCALSSPQVSAAYGTACAAYTEITTASQHGTTFLAAEKGFVYSGGGSYPRAGIQYIAGGASNLIPWIIAIPK